MHVDLNLLIALDALLEENSVAAAADRLHLSAPAMSRTLARIRKATGDDILVRTGRTMTPTPHALALREETRAAYVAALRLLARHAADPDIAVTHLLRILETDRYDEEAHLALVNALADAGRHGEAHRHYLNYRRAMDELGVEPSPFPGLRRPRSPAEGITVAGRLP